MMSNNIYKKSQYKNLDYNKLIDLGISGDMQATQELILQSEVMAKQGISSLIIDGSQVDDIYQNASIRAMKGVSNFRKDSKFSTWFYRIAINLTKNFNKSVNNQEKHKRFDTVISGGAYGDGLDALFYEEDITFGMSGAYGSQFERIDRSEKILMEIDGIMNSFNKGSKNYQVASFWLDNIEVGNDSKLNGSIVKSSWMRYQDIAKTLGITENAVKRTMCTVRDKFKKSPILKAYINDM